MYKNHYAENVPDSMNGLQIYEWTDYNDHKDSNKAFFRRKARRNDRHSIKLSLTHAMED
jgi:hypothetical protein